MNAVKRTLLLSAGALSAALILSAPAAAAEGDRARGATDGNGQFLKVGGHRGHGRGFRSESRGLRRDFGSHQGQFRGPRGHYRQGNRHWRGHRYWYRHRPYRRGHRYWWNPRYGQRYGYGYGYLGHGSHFVIRLY